MAATKGRAWKVERAPVHRRRTSRPRSNKHSKSDSDRDRKPKAGERARVGVGGYTRSDGIKLAGRYRELGA